MSNTNHYWGEPGEFDNQNSPNEGQKQEGAPNQPEQRSQAEQIPQNQSQSQSQGASNPTVASGTPIPEGRPIEREQAPEGGRRGARGTAAMDPKTRQEVARKGGLAVSRNRQHMAEIGRKGGQAVSKNREHMANIGRKGGEASRGHR